MAVIPSVHDAYLAALERVGHCSESVRAGLLGRQEAEFLRRRWLRATDEYLTHVMIPFLDGDAEVEVEIDEISGQYRYRSPQWRSRVLVRPLSEIALHAFSVDTWLDDLSGLIGINARHRSRRRERIPQHLWYLGDLPANNESDLAPVFVARRWAASPAESVDALTDPVWRRPGIVLMRERSNPPLPGGHVARTLSEFAYTENSEDRFDADTFVRVMRSLAVSSPAGSPAQYLDGSLLKLPHFEEARPLSDERLKIIKAMWGQDGATPPVKSWAEANQTANTGYTSFDDAFSWDGLKWWDIFARVGHGKYRLRRNP